ncbi:uncharacterized protein [Clytia hemisphaerica]|uniref:Uncharacterized protein n=1 Tax=Clytia hemisphaerica TaxID=252671 RepID=A0A7M5WS03_9CNID
MDELLEVIENEKSLSDEDEINADAHQEGEEAVSSIMLFSESPIVGQQSSKKKNISLNTPQTQKRILVGKSSPLLEGPLAGSVCRKMYYTRDKDLLLCKEILLTNLHDTKKGSPLRKEAWNKVTRKLQSTYDEPFHHRSVRDRFALLIDKFRNKIDISGYNGKFYEEESELKEALTTLEHLDKIDDETRPRKRTIQIIESNKVKKRRSKTYPTQTGPIIINRPLNNETASTSKTKSPSKKTASPKTSQTQEVQLPLISNNKDSDMVIFMRYLQDKSREDIELREKELDMRQNELTLRRQELEETKKMVTYLQTLVATQQEVINKLLEKNTSE